MNKEKHSVVQAEGQEELHAAKDAFWDYSGEETDCSPRGNKAEGDGECNKKNRLDDQLTGKSRKGCTQRITDRHLAAAAFRTDKEKRGDIHAGKEQKWD
jgi:hypothetical protein